MMDKEIKKIVSEIKSIIRKDGKCVVTYEGDIWGSSASDSSLMMNGRTWFILDQQNLDHDFVEIDDEIASFEDLAKIVIKEREERL